VVVSRRQKCLEERKEKGMSPYKLTGPIRVKLFTCDSAEALEQSLNEWLEDTDAEYEVMDMLYQHSQAASGEETYSCLVSFGKKEFEESM
jgi:hypothetical protein